ncbi:2854_t:CDS:2 [Paraglomus occultum]|uniref:2854_t:CDS:1 n=1 Tax=Paraglomus occultum TaxID=144539 RepID=A0A9N9A6M2_9GLOM|nr:2854_t:CDS:2 [Paraglomus occultum]
MDPCFSLKGSQACPLVNNYSITSGSFLTFYNFLPPVQNISQFDSAIEAYASNPSQFVDAGCPSIPPPRYTLTLICADLVNDPISQSCSALDVNQASPPICTETCAEFRASLYETLGNKTLCPKWNGQLGALGQRLYNFCNTSGAAGKCISGLENEATTCGFLNKTSRCEFCSQQNTTACCGDCPKPTNTSTTTSSTSSPTIITTIVSTEASKSQGLGMPAMWGLIFGSVAVVGIAIGIALFYYCVRDKPKHERLPSIEPPASDPAIERSSIASSETVRRSSAVRLVTSPEDQTFSNLQSSNRVSDSRMSGNPPFDPDNLSVASNPDVPTNEDQKIDVADVPLIDNALPGPITFPPDEDNIVIVVHPYTAQLQDELDLTPNDSIILRRIFDDGWAVGYNQNTHQEGAFPIVCVVYSHFLHSEIGTNDTLPEMSGNSEGTPLAGGLTRDSLSNSGVIRSSSISSNPSLRRQFSLTESLESVPRRNSSMRRARARSGDNDEFTGNRSSMREWGEL